MEWHVRFLETFLDKLNVPACYLAGNSFGGHIAADFASAHPERVKKLILVDAGGYPNPHRGVLAMRLAQLPVIGEILGHATPRFFIAMTIRQMYGDPRRLSEAVIDRYYDFILRAGNRETFGIILRGAAEGFRHWHTQRAHGTTLLPEDTLERIFKFKTIHDRLARLRIDLDATETLRGGDQGQARSQQNSKCNKTLHLNEHLLKHL